MAERRPMPWQLWEQGPVIKKIESITPLLASWERKDNPAQVRVQEYLQKLQDQIGTLEASADLFLHLDVEVQTPERLLHHYDLENYLTPVVQKLGPSRFRYVSARKYVGGGSRLLIGKSIPLSPIGLKDGMNGWEHFSHRAGSGAQGKPWKSGLRSALAGSGPTPLSPGQVDVQLAFRCASTRNWAALWKPAGDAMGPVLGGDTANPFNPNDDRIVSLALHCNVDGTLGHDVDVGMWWRPAPAKETATPSGGEPLGAALGPDSAQIREVYARFGLAVYQANCLERGLAIALSTAFGPGPSKITRAEFRELLEGHFGRTFGTLVRHLERVGAGADLIAILRPSLETRNRLIHHYFWEHAVDLTQPAGRDRMIDELQGIADDFDQINAQLDKLATEWFYAHNGSEADIAKALTILLSRADGAHQTTEGQAD